MIKITLVPTVFGHPLSRLTLIPLRLQTSGRIHAVVAPIVARIVLDYGEDGCVDRSEVTAS